MCEFPFEWLHDSTIAVAGILLLPGAPAVPGIPAAPLPSSLFDDDIRLGFGDWLRAFALPVEFSNLPLSNRDVRLEVQARQGFVDDARRQHVLRARFTTMIAALPALLIIVSGVSLTAQLELIQRLALALVSGTFDSQQVASYRALGDSAADYAHVPSTRVVHHGGSNETSFTSLSHSVCSAGLAPRWREAPCKPTLERARAARRGLNGSAGCGAVDERRSGRGRGRRQKRR